MTEAIIRVTENGKVSLRSKLSGTIPDRVEFKREVLGESMKPCVVKLPQVRGVSTQITLSHSCLNDEVEITFLGRDFSSKRYSVEDGKSMVLKLEGDPRGTEMMVRHGDPNQESVPEEVRI
ncbi:hypothetical protein KKD37_01085 [Patescibacteria group bacterium]|nr:hypothetical protein [Patescibacteria group bacterium]